MSFVDEITIKVQAGKGGNGVVRWAHTKEKAKGGPSGGDGGRGGNIILEGVRDYAVLARYRFEKEFHAESGEDGKNDSKHGADGKDLVIIVPVGTVIKISETEEECDIVKEGERVVLFKGGMGGKGNTHFKSSTNQNPFERTKGRDGEGGEILLSLKIIANAGLIGLPNAGKSSLLNAITNSKSRVGAYPFTTLEPNLGELNGHIIADIPGLIEGASSGRGLGTKFLKHIERTGILLHLVSADRDDPVSAYKEVRKEMEQFGRGLEKKREIIILSKIDLASVAERETKRELLVRETGREVLSVTINDPVSVKEFSDRLTKLFAIS